MKNISKFNFAFGKFQMKLLFQKHRCAHEHAQALVESFWVENAK